MNQCALSGVINNVWYVNKPDNPVERKKRIIACDLECYSLSKESRFHVSTIRCFAQGRAKAQILLWKYKNKLPKYVCLTGRLGCYIDTDNKEAKLGVVIDKIVDFMEEVKEVQNEKFNLMNFAINLNENIVNPLSSETDDEKKEGG